MCTLLRTTLLVHSWCKVCNQLHSTKGFQSASITNIQKQGYIILHVVDDAISSPNVIDCIKIYDRIYGLHVEIAMMANP